MPLARIVTRFPERTLSASEYFRSQGYTVEIVSPGDFRVTPAALEITIDKCMPQEALQRAKQAVEAHQRGAAAPGAVSTKPEPCLYESELAPTAFDIAGRPVEFEAPVERRQSGQGFLAALASVLQRGWNATAGRLTNNKRVHQRPPGAAQLLSSAEMGPQPQAAEAVPADAEYRQPERAAAEERARHAQQERERAARERAAKQDRDRTEREQRQQAEAAERERREREEQERQRAARERVAAEEQRRIEQERAAAAEQARVAAEQAERERVAAAHEALIAAQRERERAQAEPQPPEVPLIRPPRQVTRPAAVPLSTLQRVIPAGLLAGSRLYLRAARKPVLTTAIAAGLLIVAGIVAYANRRPASPLSNSNLVNSNSVQQQTPFGAATISPPAPIAKPTPAVAPKPAPPRAEHRSVTKRAPAKPRRAARRLRRSTDQDDSVAEDEVVVRHFTKAPPAVTSTATAGMKKYSDMN